MRWRRSLVLATALTGVLALASLPGAPPAAAVGTEGRSYTVGSDSTATPNAPTATKPESKLWFAAGTWWAVRFEAAPTHDTDGAFVIWRFNLATQKWAKTTTVVDVRNSSRADVLWDGTKLYIASHVADETPPRPTVPSRLYRFSYNSGSGSWTLDGGFPAEIGPNASESLVLAKDATGQLWAAWTEDDPTTVDDPATTTVVEGRDGQVVVNRSTTDDATWGTPFVLEQGLSADDIATITNFGTNRLGVLWSDQQAEAPSTDTGFYFAVHDDGAADTVWGDPEEAFAGPGEGDDHLSVKIDRVGNVYALVKSTEAGSADDAVRLLKRDPSGDWTARVVWGDGDNITRPVLLLELRGGVAHAFGTWSKSTNGIFHKSAPLAGSSDFASGRGELVIDSDGVNNATVSKRGVNATSDILVLASNDLTERYWHAFRPV
jgi:hypothetical protein